LAKKLLIDREVLQTDGSYVPGIRSMAYTFTTKYSAIRFRREHCNDEKDPA